MIYLDNNATTRVDPKVVETMLPYFTEIYGNPSSSHVLGLRARAAVDRARQQVAAFLGCQPVEIYFTSGGTESNNLAIAGAARLLEKRGNHIITTSIEHSAVIEVCHKLEFEGWKVTFLSPGRDGRVSLDDVAKAMTPETVLVSIMHANNETGAIQPIADISRLCRQRGTVLHTDAAQSLGKIPVRVDDLGVNLLSVAAHKFHGPKGIGALYIRRGTKLDPVLFGAGHERGLRPGTEGVPQIIGLGKACELASEALKKGALDNVRRLRDKFWTLLQARAGRVQINGSLDHGVPNTLNVSFLGCENRALLDRVTELAASTGSACHSDVVEPSHVLTAMGVPRDVAFGAVRFSLSKFTSDEEIERAVEMLAKACAELRAQTSPVSC